MEQAMKPQAYEALQKAKALFAHPAEVRHDDIPEQITQAPEPIRKPRVVLLPPDAPKFDQHSMKEEHKKMEQPKQTTNIQLGKQSDKYVEMSVTQACEACLKKGISKPSDIAQETGKKVDQVYTALWKIKQNKKKAKQQAREAKNQMPTPKQQADEWNREPTAYEDRNYVVLRTREDYEEKIDALQNSLDHHKEQLNRMKIVVEYLEGKMKNV
jgi:uncharacterized coiled-coil DUF342 family protein